MEDRKNIASDTEHGRETYKGATTAVEIAGKGSIEHLLYAFTGLASVGLLAWAAPRNTDKIIKSARKFAIKLKNTPIPEGAFAENAFSHITSAMTRGSGSFINGIFGNEVAATELKKMCPTMMGDHKEWIDVVAMNKGHGFGNAFLSHTVGQVLPPVRKAMLQMGDHSRWANAITLGGVAGAAGYGIGWAKAFFLGAKDGNQGKLQFERMQSTLKRQGVEIKNLREDNEDLEKINNELHEKIVKVSTRLDNLRDSKEDASYVELPASADAAAQPDTHIALDDAQHAGMLQMKQPELAATGA